MGPIVTDASDHAVAGRMGVLRAPKLCHLGADHPGARAATVEDGEMVSRGTTDLSPS